MSWEVHCTDEDWFWHEGHGSRCRKTGCTNKDHDVVTHWQLQERGPGGVRLLYDTAQPGDVAWLQAIAGKLNA